MGTHWAMPKYFALLSILTWVSVFQPHLSFQEALFDLPEDEGIGKRGDESNFDGRLMKREDGSYFDGRLMKREDGSYFDVRLMKRQDSAHFDPEVVKRED